MKLHSIALNSLKRRKAKMAFLTIGLMVGVATIVTLMTLTRALSSDIQSKMDEFGANILITPKSSGLAMNYGGISMGGVTFDQGEIRESDLSGISTITNAKNIAAVSPKVLGTVKIGVHDVLLVGVIFAKELRMKQWWHILGEAPQTDQELLLGCDASRTLMVSAGETVQINGEDFKIVGVLDQTGSQDDDLVFVNLPKAQKLLGKQGKITLVEVAALCSGCPIGLMVSQIGALLPGVKVSAIQQVVEGRLKELAQFTRFSLAIAGVVIFIGSLMMFVTMMGSVTERTVEIGVFRAIGFRRSHIMRIVLFEAAMVSVLAGLLGYAVGMGGAQLTLDFMAQAGGAKLIWDGWIAGGSVALALLLGLLASLYPALHAARLDPTEALRAL